VRRTAPAISPTCAGAGRHWPSVTNRAPNIPTVGEIRQQTDEARVPGSGTAWLTSAALWSLPIVAKFSAAREGKAARTRQVRVLLVEDDLAIAEMYAVRLRLEGFFVELVREVDSALKVLAARRPDIVLLDILLPGRDGFALLEETNASEDPPPVVILSNYGAPEMVEKGLGLGAHKYLVKSRVDLNELCRSIPGWVAEWRGKRPGKQG
jgi:CheY-like chemotaxis protein